MGENEVQEGETVNVQRNNKGISPQRSKRGSLHCRRSPSSWGKGLDHDTIVLVMTIVLVTLLFLFSI